MTHHLDLAPRASVRRGAAFVAAGALLAGALAALPAGASVAAPAAAEDAETRDLTFAIQQATSHAGQYQIAASQETDELFVTSASGRPPVLVSTIAKVDPVTLAVKDEAELPIIRHGADGTQFKRLSVHGIDVDDATDTVWVTNTRDNQVSVYDRDTLELEWTSYDRSPDAPVTQVEVTHPREVKVDEKRGLAYVSAANRGEAAPVSITVYDTTTYAVVEEIVIPDRANYPSDGLDSLAVTMGLTIDEATGRVFANDLNTDEYYIVDAANDFKLSRHTLPNSAVATNGAKQASGVAVNLERNELYSANQKGGDANTGSLDVFDLETNTLKYSLTTGVGSLTVAADTDNDLIYVGALAGGSVTVVDARTHEVIEVITPDADTTDTVAPRVNHLTVLNGSAYAVDKTGDNPVTIDYAVDLATGAVGEAEVSADNITRITPNAKVDVAETGYLGQTLHIDGAFLRNKLGDVGSKIGVKIEAYDPAAPTAVGTSVDHVAGHTVHPNASIWAVLDADAQGNLSLDLELPDGTTSGAQGSVTPFTPGTYGLRLLTGALLAPAGSDTVRSLKIPFTVAPALASQTAPVVSGKTAVGSTLRATGGTFTPTGAVLSYQWLRNGTAIAGADRASYQAVAADAGKKLAVRVSATHPEAGTAVATSAARPVVKGTLQLRTAPDLRGKATVGKKLVTSGGAWAQDGLTKRYQWLRNGTVIKGATKASYLLKKADAGKRVKVVVTVTKAGYHAKSVSTKTVKVKK